MDLTLATDELLEIYATHRITPPSLKDAAQLELAKRDHAKHLTAAKLYSNPQPFEDLTLRKSVSLGTECKCDSRHLFNFGHEQGCKHA